jgi:hypothetical protein
MEKCISSPTRDQNIALQCPKLTETNYTTWAIMMETILKAYGVWETLEDTEKVDERKMHTTKAMILTTLREDILMQVAQYSKAKEVWESVGPLYLVINNYRANVTKYYDFKHRYVYD